MTAPQRCTCGATYRDFRTGETFASIRLMMYVADPDPATWRYKRRRAVLGYWRQYKLGLWAMAHSECPT